MQEDIIKELMEDFRRQIKEYRKQKNKENKKD